MKKSLITLVFVLLAGATFAQLKIYNTGKVAVGNTATTPQFLLDLIGGDINTQSARGYRIDTFYVLRNNNHHEDIFVGVGAGNATMTGHYITSVGNLAGHANTTGTYNTFLGYGSGYNNTTGSSNTSIGHTAMCANTTGVDNTFTGSVAGYHNTTGSYNTFIGAQAGYTNTIGANNVFIGLNAGYSFNPATTSGNNTAVGNYAGQSITTGIGNTYLGYYSGIGNTTGNYNTNSGYNSGISNTTGRYNTYLGYGANAGGNNYYHCTAIGYNAVVTDTNAVWIGSSTGSKIGGWLPWFSPSDGRFKTNIQENVKGLEFICKLRPITYQMNTKQLDDFIIQNMPDSIKTMHQSTMNFAPSSAIIHSGFIAQEVDSVANVCGYVSSIVHRPANNTDPYTMAYSEFVVPLVKAVQELSKKTDSLQILNKLQQKQIAQIQNDLAACCGKPTNTDKMKSDNTSGQGNNETTIQVELASINQIILYQNEPNPFDGSTVIRYFIPENIQIEGYMVFYDSYGNEIKKVEIKETGAGKIEANAQNLAAGIYSYSLIVNGKVVDTKKMMKNK